MILINDNWEQVESLHDISKIIRQNFNAELADKLDLLIPEYTDEEYKDLQCDYENKCDKIDDLENEVDDLEKEIERLESEIEELESK